MMKKWSNLKNWIKMFAFVILFIRMFGGVFVSHNKLHSNHFYHLISTLMVDTVTVENMRNEEEKCEEIWELVPIVA